MNQKLTHSIHTEKKGTNVNYIKRSEHTQSPQANPASGRGAPLLGRPLALLACMLVCMAFGASPAFAAGLPEATVLPTVSPSTPHLGKSESGTSGSWTNGPTSLGYQWRRCNATGTECVDISGATSASYTPVEADVEHSLLLKVTATNSEGSGAASSAATGVLRPVGQVAEYKISNIIDVATGTDGNLWVSAASGQIKKVSTTGVVLNTYQLVSTAGVNGITAGPDGRLWFTQPGANKIGKITTSGGITEYNVPVGSEPREITTGPDKNLWFTNKATSKIGKITTSGTITEYTLPAGSEPYGITSGPDGALWFTNRGTSKIGKITTSGTITEYALPLNSWPFAITSGPSEALWFTDYQTSKIGKITTSGTITEYALPENSNPGPIALGPNENLWFTDHGSKKVGRITSSGVITEYTAGGSYVGLQLSGITVGPEENMWFTAGTILGNVGT